MLEPPPSPGKSSAAKEAQNFLQLRTRTRVAGGLFQVQFRNQIEFFFARLALSSVVAVPVIIPAAGLSNVGGQRLEWPPMAVITLFDQKQNSKY